jgi:hypothetical protein
MNLPAWMQTEFPRRQWTPRTRGRRKTDRRMRPEMVLGAVVVGAWAWGAYEVTLLFLRH